MAGVAAYATHYPTIYRKQLNTAGGLPPRLATSRQFHCTCKSCGAYDPQTQQFLTRDPVEALDQQYVYANRNPVNFVDPTSTVSQPLFANLLGQAQALYAWLPFAMCKNASHHLALRTSSSDETVGLVDFQIGSFTTDRVQEDSASYPSVNRKNAE